MGGTSAGPQTDRILPAHIAIIMDGNGRWARSRNLPRLEGHRRGAETVRRMVESCCEEGVSYLTLYAFSSENWSRPAEEVTGLMGLLKLYLKSEVARLNKEGVRIRFLGERARLSSDVLTAMEKAEEKTKDNSRLNLNIALNYGSRDEILMAARSIADKAEQGELSSEDITADLFADHLYTAGMPDPDLLIRTSGEERISNFLLWQLAYTELYFTDILWPDFSKEDLKTAMKAFTKRQRRYGGV